MKPLNVVSGFAILNEVGLGRAVAVRLSEIVAIRGYEDSTALFMSNGIMFSVHELAEEILATIGVENEKTTAL